MLTVRKSLAWSLAERHINQIIAFISSMILARLLTPEQIGIFSLCAAFTAMATIFRDFGISEYIIQEKNLTKEKLRGAYALAFIMAWIMAVILFLTKGFIADFYDEQGLNEIITVLCITFIILPFASPGFALMNREMAFNKIFIIQFASTLVHAGTAVVLAYQGFGYMSMAWASLASIIIQTVLITIFRPRDSLILPDVKQIKHVWKFGLTFSSSRTIEVIMNNAHELIIARQFSFTQLGLFSRASGIIKLFWQNVTSAATRVAAPSFAAAYHRSEKELLEALNKAVSIFTVIAWPFFCFVALEAENIIYILFGKQWVDAAPIASILAIAALVHSLITFAPNALIAMGKVKRRFWISLIIAPVHIIGVSIASFFDIHLVAMIWSITWVVALVLYNHHLTITLGFTYKQLVACVKKSLLVTLLCFSPVYGLHYLWKMFSLPDIASLLLNSVFIIAFWLVAIFVSKHPAANEVSNVFGILRDKVQR